MITVKYTKWRIQIYKYLKALNIMTDTEISLRIETNMATLKLFLCPYSTRNFLSNLSENNF